MSDEIEAAEEVTIDNYSINVFEINYVWNSLYLIINPTDEDGDILLSSKGIGGDGVYFSKEMIPALIKALDAVQKT